MIKISVIIPVYNSEKYLEKCLNNLINQTLKEIEFIFINDGSTDQSKDIIEKYQKNDKRIKLFNQENSGQGKARNRGLKESCGEYVAFLDSDDYIDNRMYEILYNRAKKDNLDIVLCNYYLEYKNKRVENKNNITTEEEKEITPSEYITLSPSPWNKIIKRAYIEKCNFKFKEGIIYEDLASIPLLGLSNPKVAYLNKCLYHYVQSDNSTVRNNEYKAKYENLFDAINYLYNQMNHKGYNEELEYLITYHFLYLGSLNFYQFKKYKNLDRISKEMHIYAPRWSKNNLVKKHFTKQQIIYMKLFYYRQYFIINIYRRLFAKNEIN